MSTISIVSPVYNEEANLAEFVARVESVFDDLPQFDYEIIFVDNDSTDESPRILRELAEKNTQVKVVFNAANFGHLKNQFYALTLGGGDAVILLASDLQDPPELIPTLLTEWQEGAPVVLLQKTRSDEAKWMFALRGAFYWFMEKIADHAHVAQANGAGLYDQPTVSIIRGLRDANPYLRGLTGRLGIAPAIVGFTQPVRTGGKSSNNLFSLFDLALLGVTASAKWPVRVPLVIGAVLALVALPLLAFDPLPAFFTLLAGMVMFFTGLVGEYVVYTLSQLRSGPLVIERERVGWSDFAAPLGQGYDRLAEQLRGPNIDWRETLTDGTAFDNQ